ncbi:anti-sigma factor [Microbacterium limosum]|uniref:Regulator of SigK n=1 Tax=Microbacterium limosum TaxID=3079935 RepID=A0AAU0MFK1_9MICO|nr:anti-sigma factor [Microbacterium sp. Y20]WOQ69104.1 anti-sigma factor [Microbacterium sp. Y20]
MNEQHFAELAAGHALHALSPDDEREFALALAAHPEWEHHVRADAEALARLADLSEPIDPPARVRHDVLARIGAMPQFAAEPRAEAATEEDVPVVAPPVLSDVTATEVPAGVGTAPTRRGLGRRGWFALAASLALLLGIGGAAAIVTQQFARPAAVVALEQIERAEDAQSASTTLPDGGEATVHWSSSVGEAVLVSEGLPPIEADQSYELWFVRGTDPIAAGVFEADHSGNATALLAGEMSPGDVIAVTVEPLGGSPTGEPSSDPILAIPTA